MSATSYELDRIEWKLNPTQLSKEFLLFYDSSVLNQSQINHSNKKTVDIELAIKSTAYKPITTNYRNFFIKELHRIRTALANHRIDDPVDKFSRYILANYTGLLKLHEAEITKPDDAFFNSPMFLLKNQKMMLRQINYDLQTIFVHPLKKTFEQDYQAELLPHPYIHAISEQPAIYQNNSVPVYKRLQWKGPINKLVTIFYELAYTDIFEGEPILNASSSEIIDFIYDHFIDKNGDNLSKTTIRTILQPSRPEKRSPEHKKYKIPVTEK